MQWVQNLIKIGREEYNRQIELAAYYLWEKDGQPDGDSCKYWFLAKQQIRRKIILWFLLDFLPCKLVLGKIFPPKDVNGRRGYSTFFVWFLGLHFAAFGIASSRHEAQKDSLEIRMTFVVTQLGTNARKRALSRVIEIQKSKIAVNPEILPKFWTPYTSLFGNPCESEEVVGEVKSLIVTEKDNLQELVLENIDLSEAQLQRSELSYSNLKNADLKGVNLKQSRLVEAFLEKVDLKGADLEGANLIGADLYEANLENARLWLVNLENASLRGANLKGVDLEQANLQGTDLLTANLEGASFGGVTNLNPQQVKEACNWQYAEFDDDFWKKLESEPDPNPRLDCSQWEEQIWLARWLSIENLNLWPHCK